MLPFELLNRYHLDAWNEAGEVISVPPARWFSSKTHWCNTPYLLPVSQKRIEYHNVGDDEARGSWFGRGKKPRQNKVEVTVTPPLFDDLSMVRLGREADDVIQVMRAEGDIRTGLSSPKRYLWADDASWLEGAFWHMADPADRCRTGAYAATLRGPFLRFIHEDDRDFLLEHDDPKESEYGVEAPLKPRYAPRAMMTAALYELLCQAYSYVNSPAYRNKSGESGRTREIRTLTLSYPSGMILEERKRFEAQGNKAISIFAATLGKNQRVRPELNLGIDEASAVHLSYIWSELRMLGQDPRLWFSTLRQDRGRKKPKAEEAAAEPAGATPAARRRGRPGIQRPGEARAARGAAQTEAFGDEANEIRIACMDIGGGTTDLMIAKYNFESKIDDSIRGQVLHQDGISLGGDQLVKRLLEVIIVPHFADALGMEDEDVQLLFGAEVPRNREFRASASTSSTASSSRWPKPISTTPRTTSPTPSPTLIPTSSIPSWSSRCKRSATRSAGRATTTPSRNSTWPTTAPSSRASFTTSSTSCSSTFAAASPSWRPTWSCWPGSPRSSATSSSWSRCTCRSRRRASCPCTTTTPATGIPTRTRRATIRA